MSENIKHMRQIIENNDLTNDMTRVEASVVLDLIELEMRERTQLAYHTAPGEMEFAPEGWTWKQQSQRNHERIVELEAERDRAKRELETVAMRLESLHEKIDSLARKPEPDQLADDRCIQCGKRCPNATCPACQEANERAYESGLPKVGID